MRLVYRNKFNGWLSNGFHLQSLTSTRHQTKLVTHAINFCQRSRLTKTNHLNYVRTNLVTMWLNSLCFIDNFYLLPEIPTKKPVYTDTSAWSSIKIITLWAFQTTILLTCVTSYNIDATFSFLTWVWRFAFVYIC